MIGRKQMAFLEKKENALLECQPNFSMLRDKLLSIGGEGVVPLSEPDLDIMLERGEVCKGRVRLEEKGLNHCHSNSAEMWLEDEERYNIVTGWSLCRDGLWRQHSWIFDNNKSEIIETTLKRKVYFGVFLSQEESERFYRDNA